MCVALSFIDFCVAVLYFVYYSTFTLWGIEKNLFGDITFLPNVSLTKDPETTNRRNKFRVYEWINAFEDKFILTANYISLFCWFINNNKVNIVVFEICINTYLLMVIIWNKLKFFKCYSIWLFNILKLKKKC